MCLAWLVVAATAATRYHSPIDPTDLHPHLGSLTSPPASPDKTIFLIKMLSTKAKVYINNDFQFMTFLMFIPKTYFINPYINTSKTAYNLYIYPIIVPFSIINVITLQ